MKKRGTGSRGKPKTKISPERAIVYSIGALAVGGALFYAGKKLLGKRNTAYDHSPEVNVYLTSGASGKSVSQRNDNFPLRKGSKGPRVVLLQQALEKLLGKDLLSQYTQIDGDWGVKTEEAVKLAKLPTVIDQDTFSRITGSQAPALFSPDTLAVQLYRYALQKNPEGVLSVLAQIKTVSDYTAVNRYFIQQQKLSVARSVVTYLLDVAFPAEGSDKERIRTEFRRMGLVERNRIWSLSGVEIYRDLITITDTYVIDPSGQRIPVSRNTILGEEVLTSNGLSYFNTIQGHMHAVPAAHVKYA